WVSTKPGITIRPVMSSTSASALISGWTAAILPSSIRTSPLGRSPVAGSIEMTYPARRSVRLVIALPPQGCSVRGETPDGRHDLGYGGDDLLLQRVGERQRHALRRHPPHGRVQQAEP